MESFVIPQASNINVGENEVIKLRVPVDATGNVTVVIDGEEYVFDLDGPLGAVYKEGEKYTVAISGGSGELVISGLPKGEYTVSVKYNGDDKYMPSVNSTIFTVSKEIADMEIVDQGNGTVVVKLPENATGNVTLTVENKTYTAEVINGTATVTLENVTHGVHNVTVNYSGDTSYASQTKNSTVNVPKYESPISVSVEDIHVGDVAHVVVTTPEGATGKVTIEINGIEYSLETKNGKAEFDVSGLAFGNKTVAVKYAGDDSYVENFTTGQFEVSKNPSTVQASSNNIKVGKDEVITITVPKDQTGRVLVDVDGVGYYADIVNGKAKVIISDLGSGKYTAKVTYEGDDKYLPSQTTTSFTVSKVNPPVKATGDEIEQGESATVVVNVPSDATGTVTITVDGKKFTTVVENGKAIFTIPGLTKGDYEVIASYSGDDKYEPNDNITDIEVYFNETPADDGEHKVPLSGENSGISLSKYATANPILVLLLIILVGCTTQLRRFKK